MSMIKRFSAMLMAVIMVLTMMPVTARAAAGPAVTMNTAAITDGTVVDEEVKPSKAELTVIDGELTVGDKFYVPVMLSSNMEQFNAFNFEFEYTSALKYIGSKTNFVYNRDGDPEDPNDFAKALTYGSKLTDNPDANIVTWASDTGVANNGTVCIIYAGFEVIAQSATGEETIGVKSAVENVAGISMTGVQLADSDITYVSGTVSVEAAAQEEQAPGYYNGETSLTFAEIKADNYTLTAPGEEGYYFAGWFKGLESSGITKDANGYYVLSAGTASGTSFEITESRPKYDENYDTEAVYNALWVHDDESTFRSVVLAVMDSGEVKLYSKSTADNNQITVNNTSLLNETIQTVAGAGRIKLIKDMASYKLSNYKAVEETYVAPAIRMDMNGCALTLTAENGECFSIDTRTENNLTQCIESSRGKGKITGTGGTVLDVEDDTILELRDLQITAADSNAIQLGVGTNLAKVERCDITLQSGSGAAIYVLGNSTYPATVGVIDGCTINSTGYLIQIAQSTSTVGPISNTTMIGTGGSGLGGTGYTNAKLMGYITFGSGNTVKDLNASYLMKVKGITFTTVDGTYQAKTNVYHSSRTTVTAPSGYALRTTDGLLMFVPSYEVHFYSYDGSELLKTQALEKGDRPSDYIVTYSDEGLNGYDHVGWTLTPGGTELVDLSTITSETINLYAVRTAVTREAAVEVTVNGQTKQYTSFANALAAKGTDYQDAEGEHITIKLLKDATSTSALAFSNSSLTLDLNGHTLEFISGATKVFTDKGTVAGRKLTITSTADTKGNFIYFYNCAMVSGTTPADIEFNNLNISCTGSYGMGDIIALTLDKGLELQKAVEYSFNNCQSSGICAVALGGGATTIPAVIRFENCRMDNDDNGLVTYFKKDGAVVVYVDANSTFKTSYLENGVPAPFVGGISPTVPAGYTFGDSDGDGWYQAECQHLSWTDATCSTPKTCDTCGATEGNKLDHSYTGEYDVTDAGHAQKCVNGCGATNPEITEHTYENGKCACGKEEPVVGDKLTALSISLRGNIAFKAYYALTEGTLEDEGAYMLFKIDGVEIGRQYVKNAIGPDSDGDYYFECEVAAPQMTKKVNMQIVYSDGTASEVKEYSVKDYAVKKLNNANASESVKELMRNMLNYGTYSQILFNYNTDNLANANVEGMPDISNITAETITQRNVHTGGASGISIDGYSALLQSETTFVFDFKLADGADIANYTFSYVDVSGKTLTLEPKLVDGCYRVYIENVPAAYLDHMYTLTVTNTQDQTTYSIESCVLCYLRTILNNANNTDAKRNMARALYLYNQAANTYFGK